MMEQTRRAGDFPALAHNGADSRAAISHALRTPLTIIAGYVEILQGQESEPLTPGQQRMLATVDRNTAKLRRLIEDILEESRVESRAFKTARSPVSLTALADAAAAAARPKAAARGVTVATAHQVRDLVIHGDQGQLTRLLSTLLSSAVMSAPDGSHVQVTAAREGGAAVLRVTRTATGTTAARQRAAAFPRSLRGAEASFSLCRTIAANHGGDLELEPSTVVVRVPLPRTPQP